MKLSILQVLLIDDDKPTNFFNKMIIEKYGDLGNVSTVTSGLEALEYFKEVKEGKQNKPSLVFLDINMPGMNGWEFLKEFVKFGNKITDGVGIFMLTTSDDEKEIEKAEKHSLVLDFLNKPLSPKLLDNALEKYFCTIAKHGKNKTISISR